MSDNTVPAIESFENEGGAIHAGQYNTSNETLAKVITAFKAKGWKDSHLSSKSGKWVQLIRAGYRFAVGAQDGETPARLPGHVETYYNVLNEAQLKALRLFYTRVF